MKKTIAVTFLFCLAAVALSGCATLRKVADTALTVGGATKPEYAGVIEQIRKVLDTSEASPVDGFTFRVVWKVNGEVTPADQITYEEIFSRLGSADKGVPSTTVTTTNKASDGTAVNAKNTDELRKKIEAILDAAGIPMEE